MRSSVGSCTTKHRPYRGIPSCKDTLTIYAHRSTSSSRNIVHSKSSGSGNAENKRDDGIEDAPQTTATDITEKNEENNSNLSSAKKSVAEKVNSSESVGRLSTTVLICHWPCASLMLLLCPWCHLRS
ncbi:hypothetical protein TRVL_05368 [Trypanosoma vivax]|nr:hypothetical protein TRVL_05368 [Trypanosoma vivax]